MTDTRFIHAADHRHHTLRGLRDRIARRVVKLMRIFAGGFFAKRLATAQWCWKPWLRCPAARSCGCGPRR